MTGTAPLRAGVQWPALALLAALLAGCAPDSSAPGPEPRADASSLAASGFEAARPAAAPVATPAAAPAATIPAAPDWQARDLEGAPFALADLRGEVVVLNIWATWCAPCLREMPKLEVLADDYAARGVRVVGVSIDRSSALRQVRSFIEELGIGFTIVSDPDQAVMTAFGALGVPETFLIDREGRVRHRWTGEFDPGAAEERARIDAVL